MSNAKSKSSKHNKQQNSVTESIFNQGRSHQSSSSSSKREQLYNPGNRSSQNIFHEPSALSKREQLYNPGNRPSQSTFHENTWKKDHSRDSQSRSSYSSVSDSVWSDSEEHFPALGAAAVSAPKTNVWEKRMSKQEEIKGLQPQNEYDEEAMLQQAIALSLLEATEEEEKRKKTEEEYKMQMELLQSYPELVEDFDASDEFVIANSKPEVFDDYNDFQSTEKCEKEEFSGKCVSNFSQIKKTHSSGGARPKISKVIDSFGGWGLKGNNSEKLSDFVDEVVNERSEKQIEKSSVTCDYQNSCKGKNVKEKVKSDEVDLWGISDTDVKNSATIQESWDDDEEEIVYDKKGTFVDNDEKDDRDSSNDMERESTKLPDVSPNKVLDKWLSSDNIDEWNKEEHLKEKQISITRIQNDDNFTNVPCNSNKPITGDLKNKDISDSLISYSSNDIDNSVSKNVSNEGHYDLLESSPKIGEFEKNTWSNVNDKQNEPLKNISSLYRYDINDQSRDFSLFNKSTELPTLTDNRIWLDGSSSSSSYFSSFSDKQELSKKVDLNSKTETIKFGNDIESKTFDMTLNNEADLPPILPPQPAPTMPVVNNDKAFTSEVPDANSKVIPPPVSLPPSVPEMPLPQFPVMNNPLFNPIFPGISPVFGLGMDPILMRQMLMLSNPFFASQILAMEHHYRSLGMPIDLFSVPTPIPNIAVPGMMGPSLVQNCETNAVNSNISLNTSLSPNPFENSQFANVAENNINSCEQKSFGRPSQSSGLATDFKTISSSLENESGEPWYKSYLSGDSTAVIPPPKPLSNDISCNNLMSVSELSKSSQSASKSNNTIASTSVRYDSSSQLLVAEKQSCKPISAIDTCITKTEVTGWSDPEDDSFDTRMSKTTPWNDGWDDDPMPTKPVRNPSLYEDRKKTVCRQPAKQPQISRYQKNRTYN